MNQFNVENKGTRFVTGIKGSQVQFRIAIDHQLENGYQFKDMKQSNIKDFNRFVNETVGKKLSISETESMFRRNRGPKESINIDGITKEIVHFGKDRTTFRIFGYYDDKDYFCIHRVDPNHTVHRSN